MDQTKSLISNRAVLCESAYGCITARRLIIQCSQRILIIDIITSRNSLWDQMPQTIRKLHELNKKTTRFQPKRVIFPELLTYSHEGRLPNHLIQTTRIDQTLPIWAIWAILLTWIDFDPCMDKWSHAQQSMSWNYLSHSQTSTVQPVEVWEWTSYFILHFIIDVITYQFLDYS